MKSIKWVFVLYSVGALFSMFAIGVSVGMRSIPAIIISILLLITIMGFGFKTKKKMRDEGSL